MRVGGGRATGLFPLLASERCPAEFGQQALAIRSLPRVLCVPWAMFPRGRLYSSVVERQSCKLKVLGSIPSGGFLLEAVSRHTVIYCCLVLSAFRLRVQTLWHVLAVFSQAAFPFSFQDTVSEWLRRWTRNPLGSARRGSNPLGVAFAFCCHPG